MDERGNLDLAIARIPFLKAAERAQLAESLDREDELPLLSSADFQRMFGRSFAGKEWKPAVLLAAAAKDRALSARSGIAFVPYVSPRYPPLLRELPDPPTVLFFRGTLPDPERPSAAVVGTRKPTGEALAQAYAFGRQFGECKISVVSGLALGIDTMAHRGNLDAGSPTIAVLGSGLDEVYPKSNRVLARRIVETGGALVGEYACGEPPRKWNFPARNRIIAGLARATVIVEAPESSGALITADFAADQGRDLWVASVGVTSSIGGGTRSLAEAGAPIATSAFDIVADWGLPFRTRMVKGPAAPASSEMGRAALGRAAGAALAEELARSLEIELQ
jgi:DNA processing protein